MSRYYEAYHTKIINYEPNKMQAKDINEDAIATIHGADDSDLAEYKEFLKHDWHTKNSFIDHISDSKISLDSFSNSTFKEYGDFANQSFEILNCSDGYIHFQREGGIYIDNKKHLATLDKIFFIDDEQINFNIILNGVKDRDLYYLQEHNLHFANLKDVTINSNVFEKDFCIKETNELEIYDGYTDKRVIFKLSQKVDIFISSLDTLSQSEAGFDLTNQGISIGFLFSLNEQIKISGQVWVR
jgi:hypothetical protein